MVFPQSTHEQAFRRAPNPTTSPGGDPPPDTRPHRHDSVGAKATPERQQRHPAPNARAAPLHKRSNVTPGSREAGRVRTPLPTCAFRSRKPPATAAERQRVPPANDRHRRHDGAVVVRAAHTMWCARTQGGVPRAGNARAGGVTRPRPCGHGRFTTQPQCHTAAGPTSRAAARDVGAGAPTPLRADAACRLPPAACRLPPQPCGNRHSASTSPARNGRRVARSPEHPPCGADPPPHTTAPNHATPRTRLSPLHGRRVGAGPRTPALQCGSPGPHDRPPTTQLPVRGCHPSAGAECRAPNTRPAVRIPRPHTTAPQPLNPPHAVVTPPRPPRGRRAPNTRPAVRIPRPTRPPPNHATPRTRLSPLRGRRVPGPEHPPCSADPPAHTTAPQPRNSPYAVVTPPRAPSAGPRTPALQCGSPGPHDRPPTTQLPVRGCHPSAGAECRAPNTRPAVRIPRPHTTAPQPLNPPHAVVTPPRPPRGRRAPNTRPAVRIPRPTRPPPNHATPRTRLSPLRGRRVGCPAVVVAGYLDGAGEACRQVRGGQDGVGGAGRLDSAVS